MMKLVLVGVYAYVHVCVYVCVYITASTALLTNFHATLLYSTPPLYPILPYPTPPLYPTLPLYPTAPLYPTPPLYHVEFIGQALQKYTAIKKQPGKTMPPMWYVRGVLPVCVCNCLCVSLCLSVYVRCNVPRLQVCVFLRDWVIFVENNSILIYFWDC